MAISLSLKQFFKFILLVLTWLVAFEAFALQISSPVLYSRQGEPLKLSFLITDISAAETQELKVALAENKIYQGAQIVKVDGLDGIHFQISTEPNGQLKVLMTGAQAISTAHADLIIDLSWSTGRRYINLGVDFDSTPPPAAKTNTPAPEAPAPATAPVAAQETAVTQVGKAEPINEKALPPANPAETASSEEKTTASAEPAAKATAPVAEVANTTSAVAATANTDVSAAKGIEVKTGDTASKLLMANPVQGVSLDQLLLAMLNMNPNAFVKDNVNRLVAGAIVTLPNADEAGTYDPKHARETIRLQAADFKTYRASLAANAPSAKQTSKRESRGNLKADVAPTAKAPDDQLTLSKPGDTEADKLSKQLQAEDTAKQTKDVEDNLRQMGQLSQAMEKFKQGFAANFPMLSATYDLSIDWASRNLYELIGGLAVLIALLVGWSVLRDRRQKASDNASSDASSDFDQHGFASELNLPPEFNLDLDTPSEAAPPAAATPATQSPPPNSAAINPTPQRQQVVSSGEDPFLMRLELADELWALGQKQTAMALAQEVADQTHGETRELAQRWLKDKA